jgi:hypothetical protein
MVGLFNTSMFGLRAGSGLTVGVLGAVIGVQWSLTFSSAAVVLVALGLLAVDARARPRLSVQPRPRAVGNALPAVAALGPCRPRRACKYRTLRR